MFEKFMAKRESNPDLLDASAVLYQLSCQVNYEPIFELSCLRALHRYRTGQGSSLFQACVSLMLKLCS